MISLCITGHSAAAIAAAHAALQAAGMAPARGLERDSHITFSTWHERVYQALVQRLPEPGDDEDDGLQDAAPATMGRLWEQLANDLFLANMDAKVWGWADAKSLGLLDFWLELDASTHFVLLATSPENFVAEHLAQLTQESGRTLQDLPLDRLMDQWQQAHQAMLRFALHHPKRCVLLLAELPLPADALVQAVKGAWARKLKALRTEPVSATALEPLSGTGSAAVLLRHFAAEICQAYPQAQSLQHEIASVAFALQMQALSEGISPALLDGVISTVSLANRVPVLQGQTVELVAKFDAQAQIVAQSQAQIRAELQARLDEEAQAKNQVLADAARQQLRLRAAEEEGGLLLAQLHQSQEELERYHLHNTELAAQIQSISAARDAEITAKAEVLKQREAEASAKAQAFKQLEASAKEKTALTAARDAEIKAKAEALKQRDALAQEKVALATARDAEIKAKTEALKQRDALVQEKAVLAMARDAETKAKAAALEKVRAADQENELLLAQLHQVQEEMERFYLRNKDLETTAAQAGQRFSRMVSREPYGIDWESVQVEVEPRPGSAQVRCRATEVSVAGKSWDSIEFTAHIHNGALAFTFDKSSAVLTRWPRSAAAIGQITFVAGSDAIDQEGSSLVKEISTSDWDLLRGLPKLVAQGLQQNQGPWPQDALARQAWLDAARATLPALQRHPPALRVDTLRLLANRVLTGREYLVLRAEQLTFAGKRFAALDFRLGCNFGDKGEFGQNARLEFFKGSSPCTFDNWAPNVQDPAGDRLDLVFVFPTSMNLKDWTALSVNDRGLVLLLVDQLPALLADLQTGDVRLTRRTNDWFSLASTLRSFARQRLDVTGIQQGVPEAVAKAVALSPSVAPRRVRAAKSTSLPAPKRSAPVAAPAVAATRRKK